jgi:peptidoglycan/LPS O-acetylase OafA/YrhL
MKELNMTELAASGIKARSGLETKTGLEAGHTERHLYSLDLLRGLAALMVLLYHIDFMYGYRGGVFDSAYLCVDLFFLLSGYVIANAYDARLRSGMSFRAFLWQRLARIYPLFLLTTVIGVGVIGSKLARDHGYWDISAIITTFAFNLTMLPSFFSPYGSTRLFPFNGATWSIFFEMWVNIIYALFWRSFNVSVLGILVAATGLWLVSLSFYYPTLDIGWDQSHFIHGFARVSFSFFLGCLMFRLRAYLPLFERFWHFALAVMMFFVVMLAKKFVPASLSPFYDLVVVVVIWPLIMMVAIKANITGLTAKSGWFLGGASFSIYLLQTPLLVFVSGLPQILFNRKIAELAPYIGVVFTIGLVILSYYVWQHFELRAQRFLRQANKKSLPHPA